MPDTLTKVNKVRKDEIANSNIWEVALGEMVKNITQDFWEPGSNPAGRMDFFCFFFPLLKKLGAASKWEQNVGSSRSDLGKGFSGILFWSKYEMAFRLAMLYNPSNCAPG